MLREADESNRGLQSEVQKMEAQLEHLQDQLNQQGEANGQLREIIQREREGHKVSERRHCFLLLMCNIIISFVIISKKYNH